MNKQIIKQLEDKEFVQKLLSLKSDDDVKKLFNKQGIEILSEELNELRAVFFTVTQKVKNMSKNDLENIAAGGDVILSDYFKKAGEHYGVHQGGSPGIRGPWYKLWLGGTPATPATPGTPLGNFLYDNSNELALASIAGVTVTAGLTAMYMFDGVKKWYQNRSKESK